MGLLFRGKEYHFTFTSTPMFDEALYTQSFPPPTNPTEKIHRSTLWLDLNHKTCILDSKGQPLHHCACPLKTTERAQ